MRCRDHCDGLCCGRLGGVSTVETLVGFFADRRAPVAPPVPAEPDLTDEQRPWSTRPAGAAGWSGCAPSTRAGSGSAWHTWDGAAVLLVTGPGEQSLPGLTGLVEVVVPSKAVRGPAGDVRGPRRPAVAGHRGMAAGGSALAAVRLNGPGPAAQLLHWAGTGRVTAAGPLTVLSSGAGGTAEPSGAAAPPPEPGHHGDPSPLAPGRPRAREPRGMHRPADGES